MKTITITLASLFLSALSFAQIAHDMEIYSEGGEKFTLTMNGRVLNEEPANRVAIQNIQYDNVHLVIDFEDENIPDIEKKYYSLSSSAEGEEGKPIATLAKIIEKDGQYKLRTVSSSVKMIQTNTIIINQENQDSEGVEISNGRVLINW